MPLNRPLLELEARPSAAQFARGWVTRVCREIGRDELVFAAQVAISELVTNALLHGVPPFGLRLRGTRDHPRVEVLDGSQEPPTMSVTTDPEDLLDTFGRGLAIVASSSLAWGAVIEETGKCVWFEPAADLLDEPTEGGVTDLRETWEEEVHEGHPVRLIDVPVAAMRAMSRHYFNLKRELRLLEFAHDSEYPIAHELVAMFNDYERLFPAWVRKAVDAAHDAGEETLNIDVPVPPGSGPQLAQMGELFDLADEFCTSQQLLALARTKEERDFEQWFLTELISQLDLATPHAWRPVGA